MGVLHVTNSSGHLANASSAVDGVGRSNRSMVVGEGQGAGGGQVAARNANASVPRRKLGLGGTCVEVNKIDSYGDGWNNAEYVITNSKGEVEASGTLAVGLSSETDELCDLEQGCYTMSVSAGNYPTRSAGRLPRERW